MTNIARSDAALVSTVNELALAALTKQQCLPYPWNSQAQVRKLADVLNACADLLETVPAGPKDTFPVDERACTVFHRATTVSRIADVLLDDSLDDALRILKEELNHQRDQLSIVTRPARTQDPDTAVSPNNEFAMPRPYAQTVTNSSGWWRMDRDALMKLIPNAAAKVFASGIAAILASAITSFFTESNLPILIFALGLGLLAVGQYIGEKAISEHQR